MPPSGPNYAEPDENNGEARVIGGYTANLTQVGEKVGSLIVGKLIPPGQPLYVDPMPLSTLNILGGTLDVKAGPTYSYIFPNDFLVGNNDKGLVNQLAGDVTVDEDLIIGSGAQNPADGTYHITGGSLNARTFIMGIGLQPGELIIDGDANDISDISAQDLIQYPTSTLNFVFGDAGTPGLSLTGSVTLDGLLTLDLDGLGTPRDAIVLIDNAGASPLFTNFSNAAEGTLYSSLQGTYALTYGYDAQGDLLNNDVAIVLVPVPSTFWLLMAGLVAFTRRREIRGAP